LESLSSSIEEYKTEIAANQKEKQILFQNISHELKTPITNIRSYAEGLEDGMFAPSEIPGASKVIQEEAARLLGSLNQVMELNRLNYHKEEKVSPSVNSVDLSVIISTIKNEIKVTNPGVEIVSDYDCSKVNGDSSSWNTIIKNIFSNNIRHGATKISITGTCHRLMIENNGESIPEELLHRLFTPFVKGEKGSYGLGLSIIKTALELNGYSITIENISKGVRYLITKNSK
jgi:two-component system sensor histidine kinase CssS